MLCWRRKARLSFHIDIYNSRGSMNDTLVPHKGQVLTPSHHSGRYRPLSLKAVDAGLVPAIEHEKWILPDLPLVAKRHTTSTPARPSPPRRRDYPLMRGAAAGQQGAVFPRGRGMWSRRRTATVGGSGGLPSCLHRTRSKQRPLVAVVPGVRIPVAAATNAMGRDPGYKTKHSAPSGWL